MLKVRETGRKVLAEWRRWLGRWLGSDSEEEQGGWYLRGREIPWQRPQQPTGAGKARSVYDYEVTAPDGTKIPVKLYGRRRGAAGQQDDGAGLRPPTMRS